VSRFPGLIILLNITILSRITHFLNFGLKSIRRKCMLLKIISFHYQYYFIFVWIVSFWGMKLVSIILICIIICNPNILFLYYLHLKQFTFIHLYLLFINIKSYQNVQNHNMNRMFVSKQESA
jgi:hypothetical protein